MDIKQPKTHQMIKRLVPPLAVWTVSKILEQPRVRHAVTGVDKRVYKGRRKAERALREAGVNATVNRGWLVAGVAAIAAGIGLMAKATTRRKR